MSARTFGPRLRLQKNPDLRGFCGGRDFAGWVDVVRVERRERDEDGVAGILTALGIGSVNVPMLSAEELYGQSTLFRALRCSLAHQ